MVLHQIYGTSHLLGKFDLQLLFGDERGLKFAEKAIANALEMYPEKRVASTQQQLFDYFVNSVRKDPQAIELKQQIDAVEKKYRAKNTAVRLISQPRLPRTTRIFNRGDFLSPLPEPVQPGIPELFSASKGETNGPRDRLELAKWLTSPDHPLTGRVAVNHLWKHLFGYGIVRTPGDFGARGEPPTHPELLDYLANRFQRDLAWSRKAMIREIVSSSVYAQSSKYRPELEAVDPLNLLLARQNRFRLEGEVLRDVHLQAAGILAQSIGGPSVFPPMPDELAKLSYANNFTWKNSEGADRYRRGMYTFFKRTVPHPNLMTFDAPDANVTCVMRTVSNTPLQSLTLLNNEVHLDAASAFAFRIQQSLSAGQGENTDTSDQQRQRVRAAIATAIERCLSRPARDSELDVLHGLYNTSFDYYRTNAADAAQLLETAFLKKQSIAESTKPELAAWTATCRILLNLDEMLTRE